MSSLIDWHCSKTYFVSGLLVLLGDSGAWWNSKVVGIVGEAMLWVAPSYGGTCHGRRLPAKQYWHGMATAQSWNNNVKFRGEWSGGLICCNQNQKGSDSNPTRHSAALTDPTSIRGSSLIVETQWLIFLE